ncbi:hypothetical protein [Leifsonia sp. NPDC058248]|uniref:hypothetical protein n=1 Tax=Leifsonia sp. NPDC058248 TaxID=3346402 RepID=UPI0036DDC216
MLGDRVHRARAVCHAGALHDPEQFEPAARPGETPAADGSVTPQDAPLAQLWALVDSSLRDAGGYADSTRGAGVIPADIHDFGSAIQTRCVPKRTPPERAELTSLWNAIAAEAKTAGADLTPAVRAYFARASALCM